MLTLPKVVTVAGAVSVLAITVLDYYSSTGSAYVNATFDCTVRNYNYKFSNKKHLRLVGKMQNMAIRSGNSLSAGL